MRLGLTTAAFYGRLETEEAAAHLRALDVDCAEAFLQTPSEYSVSFGETVKAALAGIPATSVHPLGTAFENALFSPSRRQRAPVGGRAVRGAGARGALLRLSRAQQRQGADGGDLRTGRAAH